MKLKYMSWIMVLLFLVSIIDVSAGSFSVNTGGVYSRTQASGVTDCYGYVFNTSLTGYFVTSVVKDTLDEALRAYLYLNATTGTNVTALEVVNFTGNTATFTKKNILNNSLKYIIVTCNNNISNTDRDSSTTPNPSYPINYKNISFTGRGRITPMSNYITGQGIIANDVYNTINIVSLTLSNSIGLNFTSPSESEITKYLPNNYLLINVTQNNIANYRNMTIFVYNSTGLYYNLTTSNNNTFLNLTLPLINETYYYNVTARNTTNDSINSDTYTNYIRYVSLNVSAFNISTPLTTFNVTVDGVSYNTTSGNTSINVFLGLHNVTVDAPNQVSNTSVINVNTTPVFYYDVSLYPDRYVSIFTYSETNGSLVTSATAINLVNEFYSYNSSTTTGGNLTLYDVQPGTYSLTLSNPSYSPTQYVVILNDDSYVRLNAYLKNGTAILFNYRDYGSSVIEGVSLKVYRYVNGSLTLVGSYLSDVTGKVQFYALSNTFYGFNSSKDGYAPYYFTLNPVLFTSYDIPMSALSSGTTTPSGYISYNPASFYENQVVNFRVLFTSPYDSFVSYQYAFTYPGGSVSHSGTSLGGESFNDTFVLNDSSSHIATLTYSWLLSNGASQSNTIDFLIIAPWQNKTMMNMGDNNYGMLTGDKVYWLTIMLIVVMGVAYLAVGLVGSFLFGGVVLIIMLSNGFIPFSASPLYYVFGFVAIIVIAFRGLSSGGNK